MDAARKFSDKGQVDKAIKEYQKIVQDDPKDVRVWLKIGDLFVKKGSKEEAAETYLKVAKFYGEQGFYLKAVAVYKQILKLDPRLVEVNLKLAELYRQLGLLQDAIQHFETVAAHFHREGKTREALATIRQLVDLDPENVATRIKLAELYSKENMIEEAVTEFAQARDHLSKQGRTDDFIKVAERLLWHKPDNMPLNRELAAIYLKRNDARRALQKLQTCFKANPRDLETLAQLAQAFQALDQKAKTVSVLKEMARVLVENGQRAQAEDIHRKILAYAPSDPDSLAFLGGAAGAAPAAGGGRPAPAAPQAAAVVQPIKVASVVAQRPAPSRAAPVAEPPPRGAPNKTGAMPLVRPDPAVMARPAVEEEFVSELSLDDDVGYEAEASTGGEAHSEEIVKILTESDVYVKYGLHQKAIDHLRKVFDLDAGNLEARERLKDILLAQGREAEAIAELFKMAEQTGAREPERTAAYLAEVLRLDASQDRAFELAARYRVELTDDGQADLGAFVDEQSAVAPVEESEVGFDDLDYDQGPAAVSHRPAGSSEFEFELEDDEPKQAPAARTGGTGTMEVSFDQLEEAVSVAELDGDDLDFDAVAPGDPLQVGTADDFAFNPADARAFDAAPGFEPPPPLRAPSEPAFDRDAARAFDAAATSDGAGELELAVDEPAAPPAPRTRPPLGTIGEDAAPLGRPSAGAPDPTWKTDAGSTAVGEGGGSIEDDLDEADFFVSQGLFAEARDILATLERRYPGHPLIAAKLRDVEAGQAGGPLGGDEVDDALDGFEIGGSGGELPAPAAAPARETRPAIMLEKPVDDADADTHFDLGLAYREMGLFDEAIKAFAKVRTSPGREVKSHLMIGMCHRDQGNLSEAINQFKAGLYVERISSPEKFGLYYEIGTTYEQLGDPQEALYYHEMVFKKDSTYRDVAKRVAAIRATQPAGARAAHQSLDHEADAALDLLDSDIG